ncbi:MAG: hypothetical protein LBK82_08345 [Planctomycetaceae bacterium]|nr:hypothetical protein [Planctomycetaceae bacterium]
MVDVPTLFLNAKRGGLFIKKSAGRLRRLSSHFAVVNLIHCRRVRRRNRSANGCPPMNGC